MTCGKDSTLAFGSQTSLEENISEIKTKDNEEKAYEKYVKDTLSKSSPIKIPNNVKIKIQHKTSYEQVKYIWDSDDYKYEVRWHTKTPNSPSYEKDSWVVERRRNGIGVGKNARESYSEVFVKDKWILKDKWQNAIKAKNKGVATNEQKELLRNGHFKSKKQ